VSRGCRSVATMDRLWMPLLARHFGNVVFSASLLLLSPARRFRALALTPCSVCNEILLPLKPRADPEWSRYSAPGSCVLCGLLCCTTCHCRCRCLNDDCSIDSLVVIDCERCHGWAHDDCSQFFSFCSWCDKWFCSACASEVLTKFGVIDPTCQACQRNWVAIDNTYMSRSSAYGSYL
jgi:hypothetical protein